MSWWRTVVQYCIAVCSGWLQWVFSCVICYRHLSRVWIWPRAEVMPPLCSWEQELWTVLCCTSLEKDRGISVPRILVLLLLSSDPRLTRHGRVCSVARWYSIAATQSREAFRLLQCLCHTLVQGVGFTIYLLSHLCVLWAAQCGLAQPHCSSFHCSSTPLAHFLPPAPPCRIVSAPFLPSGAFFAFPLACAHFPHHHIQAVMLLQLFAFHCILWDWSFPCCRDPPASQVPSPWKEKQLSTSTSFFKTLLILVPGRFKNLGQLWPHL